MRPIRGVIRGYRSFLAQPPAKVRQPSGLAVRRMSGSWSFDRHEGLWLLGLGFLFFWFVLPLQRRLRLKAEGLEPLVEPEKP